jgi:hypothetical protein
MKCGEDGVDGSLVGTGPLAGLIYTSGQRKWASVASCRAHRKKSMFDYFGGRACPGGGCDRSSGQRGLPMDRVRRLAPRNCIHMEIRSPCE